MATGSMANGQVYLEFAESQTPAHPFSTSPANMLPRLLDAQSKGRCAGDSMRYGMNQDKLTNLLLIVIAFALVAIAVRSVVNPRPVAAQSYSEHRLFIEPGVQLLRAPDGSKQVFGRMVIDLQTGEVWGFPTSTGDPYPINPTNTKPETSHPFQLGRFALEDMNK
jgi:hypothetical protein